MMPKYFVSLEDVSGWSCRSLIFYLPFWPKYWSLHMSGWNDIIPFSSQFGSLCRSLWMICWTTDVLLLFFGFFKIFFSFCSIPCHIAIDPLGWGIGHWFTPGGGVWCGKESWYSPNSACTNLDVYSTIHNNGLHFLFTCNFIWTVHICQEPIFATTTKNK